MQFSLEQPIMLGSPMEQRHLQPEAGAARPHTDATDADVTLYASHTSPPHSQQAHADDDFLLGQPTSRPSSSPLDTLPAEVVPQASLFLQVSHSEDQQKQQRQPVPLYLDISGTLSSPPSAGTGRTASFQLAPAEATFSSERDYPSAYGPQPDTYDHNIIPSQFDQSPSSSGPYSAQPAFEYSPFRHPAPLQTDVQKHPAFGRNGSEADPSPSLQSQASMSEHDLRRASVCSAVTSATVSSTTACSSNGGDATPPYDYDGRYDMATLVGPETPTYFSQSPSPAFDFARQSPPFGAPQGTVQYHTPGIARYSCTFADCDWATDRRDLLKQHLEFHARQVIFNCPQPDCYKHFTRAENLEAHQQEEHSFNTSQHHAYQYQAPSHSTFMLQNPPPHHPYHQEAVVPSYVQPHNYATSYEQQQQQLYDFAFPAPSAPLVTIVDPGSHSSTYSHGFSNISAYSGVPADVPTSHFQPSTVGLGLGRDVNFAGLNIARQSPQPYQVASGMAANLDNSPHLHSHSHTLSQCSSFSDVMAASSDDAHAASGASSSSFALGARVMSSTQPSLTWYRRNSEAAYSQGLQLQLSPAEGGYRGALGEAPLPTLHEDEVHASEPFSGEGGAQWVDGMSNVDNIGLGVPTYELASSSSSSTSSASSSFSFASSYGSGQPVQQAYSEGNGESFFHQHMSAAAPQLRGNMPSCPSSRPGMTFNERMFGAYSGSSYAQISTDPTACRPKGEAMPNHDPVPLHMHQRLSLTPVPTGAEDAFAPLRGPDSNALAASTSSSVATAVLSRYEDVSPIVPTPVTAVFAPGQISQPKTSRAGIARRGSDASYLAGHPRFAAHPYAVGSTKSNAAESTRVNSTGETSIAARVRSSTLSRRKSSATSTAATSVRSASMSANGSSSDGVAKLPVVATPPLLNADGKLRLLPGPKPQSQRKKAGLVKSPSSADAKDTITTPGKEPKPLHPCDFPGCEREFKRLEHQRRHMRSHTQERPYQCDIAGCGRFFSRSDNLSQHKRTHERAGRTHRLTQQNLEVIEDENESEAIYTEQYEEYEETTP